jgi:hypothetical protein
VTLARVLRRHGHAVQRDLLTLGYRKTDMFTALTVDEMVAVVVAAPPGTAVHHAVNGGYTLTDHLLATMSEQQAGLVDLRARHARPGVTDVRPTRPPDMSDYSQPTKTLRFDVMPIDEFEARQRGAQEKS